MPAPTLQQRLEAVQNTLFKLESNPIEAMTAFERSTHYRKLQELREQEEYLLGRIASQSGGSTAFATFTRPE